MLGYTREELMHTTFAAITHPDDVEENVGHLKRMLAGKEATYAAEKRYLRKDGSIVWVHMNVAMIRKEDGTPDYNITVLTDITERKRAEEALASSERFSQRVLETSPNLIYIYDLAENRNVYTNREITEFLGYTPEQILAFGSSLFEHILHPDDAALVAEHHARLHRLPPGDDRVLEVDYRMKRSDGEWRWLHSRDIPFLRDESGAVTQILGSTEDITEQSAATERLQESEAKLKALFELLPVGVSVLDAENRVTYANPALERILGLSEEGLREGDHVARTYLDGNGDPLSPGGFASARAAREGRTVEVVTGVVKEDGQVVWTDVSAAPITISDWRTIIVTADVTAEREAKELAARQAERIEQTLTSVVDVTSNLVELRDPYTAGHQRRVTELAVRIAEGLGVSSHDIDDIRVAGLLHDIGKSGVPTEILAKPGQLSPIEFELIKGHAEAGYRLAVSANMAEPIADMIHQHHERCDGSGYPQGLMGDQTLEGAKVIAVADVVEAMTSHRPYRSALGIEAAMAEIERGAGSLYDAEVAKMCAALFREGGFDFSS
jgi:PAS domain S-box-containing protein/putative nucleotidyltransferase with HDIG domain